MTATVPRSSGGRPVLSALRDRVLKVAELVTTPLLPSDYLDLVDPLRSGAALRGRIEAVQRSEEHTSELQSRQYLVCRLLLENKKHTPDRSGGVSRCSAPCR